VDSRADFVAMYQEHSRLVVRTANDVLRNPSLAEDVAQDVFLSLWVRGTYEQARGPLAPYLRMLTRSRALDLWRRNRASERTTDLLKERTASLASDAPHDELARAGERSLTRSAVRRLPAEQRSAVALAFWGDLTAEQAARAQGIPLGTAKSRLRLGLLKLARDPALGH
jgi:RNA polymerase sigma-70 factor (ECF subfamily)